MDKRKWLVLSLAAICLSVLAYGSSAFFTKDVTIHNVIATGDVDIELLEWTDAEKTEPFPADGLIGVIPSQDATKIVEVRNSGEQPVFVRVKTVKSVEFAEDAGNTADLSLFEIDFNETDWTEKDGFYYYNEILEPGETTVPLFTAVKISEKLGNAYQNCKLNVDVTAYAVQSANNGGSAPDAAGWPSAE